MIPIDENTFVRSFNGSGEEIDRAARAAVREALSEHKRLGRSVAVWQEGEVVLLSPDQIVIPEEKAPRRRARKAT